jgi:hypothetical protein
MLYKSMSQRYITRILHPSSQSKVKCFTLYHVKQKTDIKYFIFQEITVDGSSYRSLVLHIKFFVLYAEAFLHLRKLSTTYHLQFS